MSSDYWKERQALTQERLTSKSIKETEKQLEKYYSSSMSKILGQFEQVYNKVFSNITEGKEVTPADLESFKNGENIGTIGIGCKLFYSLCPINTESGE